MTKKKKFPKKLKSALTDLGIITTYEALDWADEVIAKLFPCAGEIPEESLDEIADAITFGLLTSAPYLYGRIYGEKWERKEWLERTKTYGKSALIEAGEIPPLTDFVPAYHWAWLEIYHPKLAEGISTLSRYRDKRRKKSEST